MDARETDRLEKQRQEILNGGRYNNVLSLIARETGKTSKNVFVVEEFPDQAEDVYIIVFDSETVFHVEIPRIPALQPSIRSEPFKEYRERHRGSSKSMHRRLDAIEFLSKKLQKGG